MSVVDAALGALAALFGGGVPVRGRVVDEIGDALVGASVRALAIGPFAGHELARTSSDASGAFVLCPAQADGFAIVVEAAGARAQLMQTTARADVGEIRLLTPLLLTATVGDGGDNRPRDLRRVQDRLHRLGRLSAADVAAETVILDGVPPLTPGPRLLAALAEHLAACLGRRPPRLCLEPDSPWTRALAEQPPFPPLTLALSAPVGALPGADAPTGNNAADFARVQDRLRQLGLLRPADHAAEAVERSASAPIDPATRPLTLTAIARFEREVAGSSLRAIVPGTPGARLLDDPPCYGRPALAVVDTVGAGGSNRADDVRCVQDRLLLLGHLAAADHAAERPAADVAATVAEATLPRTIAAIAALREARLGEAAPATGLLDPVDAALRRLEEPLPLQLAATVGGGPPAAAANRPADVRRLQDRLRFLGLLAENEHAAECVDAAGSARIDLATRPRTLAALAAAQLLRRPLSLASPVGRGQVNAVAGVRAVQERCHALGVLSDADFAREKVDADSGGVADDAALGSTFEAIEALRQQLLGLPAAQPDAPWTATASIAPGDETEALLRDPLFFGRGRLQLGASVGAGGWNFPADVRAVQDRLRQLRLLSPAEHAAEAADAQQRARVPEQALPATCAAIGRLRTALLGETASPLARIEPRSPALQALDDRLGALRCPLALSGSVGWDGANAPADVIKVLDRLHGLGFLAAADHALETGAARATAAGSAVRGSDMAMGISAIGRWQQVVLDTIAVPCVVPWTPLLFSLARPSLPRPQTLALGASVGRTGANHAADVRRVQDRLFELGVLDGAGYFAERADPAAAGALPDAALAATIDAILRWQQGAAGNAVAPPDGRVDAGGHAQRVLEDPSYGTPTAPNPACALAVAGPARPQFALSPLRRIALAIEQGEGGSASGEIPALLRNASRTPASFGRAQVIGGTCIDMLNSHPALAAHYGLDAARVAALAAISTRTRDLVDDIQGQVAAGWSEATLQTRIDAYVLANGASVRIDCGLSPDDIAHIFRSAQLRRHLLALAGTDATAVLFNAATHPAAAANLAGLQLTLADVNSYRQRPANHGEHRAGFITRALFHAADGQAVRNALSDDSGSRLGRLVVEINWNRTAGLANADDRAQLTAYLHNHGGDPATLIANWNTVTSDDYVIRTKARYDAIPP